MEFNYCEMQGCWKMDVRNRNRYAINIKHQAFDTQRTKSKDNKKTTQNMSSFIL